MTIPTQKWKEIVADKLSDCTIEQLILECRLNDVNFEEKLLDLCEDSLLNNPPEPLDVD